MRVIGGKFGSRRLSFPKSKLTRPMTDRAKETVFNILGARIASAIVLDLFAGSGSLGIEALSRGGQSVVFVDHSEECQSCIDKNLVAFDLKPDCRIMRSEAGSAIRALSKKGYKFDLIFLDPPHNKGFIKKLLHRLDRSDIVAPSGIIVVGHSDKEGLPERFETLYHERTAKIGQSFISFIVRVGSNEKKTGTLSGEL